MSFEEKILMLESWKWDIEGKIEEMREWEKG